MSQTHVARGRSTFLDHTVDWLRSHGITDIAMNLHHAGDVIVDHFGAGGAHGVHITYSHEPQLLGTAGAAKKLESFLDETFVVVYGDVLTNVDLNRLLDFHRGGAWRAGVPATISPGALPGA
ncbi:MAG: sugar phosphate nucleotidyltransferase [Caldilineaceae bacterium]